MLRMLIGAAVLVLVLVSATAAPAQITGPVPNMGQFEDPRSTWNPWTGRAEVPEDAGREHEIERYRETLKTKIPNRKPSNDPWRNIRPAAGKQHERE